MLRAQNMKRKLNDSQKITKGHEASCPYNKIQINFINTKNKEVKMSEENKENIENQENVHNEENAQEETQIKPEVVDQNKQELEELTDRYKRVLAEFENFKKRSGKERENLYKSILADIVEAILPIMDNLENALKVETKDESYKQGVELVYKQFQDVLSKFQVEEIETIRQNIRSRTSRSGK